MFKHNSPLGAESLKVKEPSQAFLEEDIVFDCNETQFPEEVLYMIKNIRVFGFFEKPLFVQLCQKIEFINVNKGAFLFQIRDPDDSIYIVQSGEIQVTLTEPDGTVMVLKNVRKGESIVSMLSVMDVLMGKTNHFRTISAYALQETTILKLKIDVLKDMVQNYPDLLIRVVQIIMVRLQRVIFISLNKYLGLTTQLINSNIQIKKASNAAFSPIKKQLSEIRSRSHARSYSTTDAAALSQIWNENSPSKPADSLAKDTLKAKKMFDDDRSKLTKRRKSVFTDDRTTGVSPEELMNHAVSEVKQLLNFENEVLLRQHLSIKEFQKDILLESEDIPLEEKLDGLLFLLSGSLIVTQKSLGKKEETDMFIIYPGEIIGALAMLTGEQSIFTVRTLQQCKGAVISRESVFDLIREQPSVALNLANSVIQRLSLFVRQIDFALDWMHCESGRAIYKAGEESDSTFIVLSGRLRSVVTLSSGKRELVGEYGKGDLVGIVETITHTPRTSTVMAVRDTELAKLPDGLLEAIKLKYPVVVTGLIHLLGQRLLHSSVSGKTADMGSRPTGSNFSTIALLQVTDDVPISSFAYELRHALASIGPVTLLTSEFVKETLGQTALDRQSEYRLCSWLGLQEDQHKVVLYQCDKSYTAWTQRCIRQADCVLIVGLAENEPSVSYVEKQLEHLSIRTQKELVLLHHIDGPRPKNTVDWLNMREWCSSNHHIRCPKRVFSIKGQKRIEAYYKREQAKESKEASSFSTHTDFHRLARFLTGQSIGLVLGGGGARGSAHCGMVKAILEWGLPIDMVGGVSIGSFMGALWCMENNLTTFIQKAHNWSMGMTSIWPQLLDLTYPSAAMFTGHAFNTSIYKVFGDIQIEDLWIPYFNLTTDITSSCPRIHRHGSLWRYVRASMSLSGYLPPLCDPLDGHLLLDGGYVNNLPADVMHDVMGAKTIMAIDVGSQDDDSDITNYGDQLNGWWLLWKRWYPFTTQIRVPNLPEIQMRLAYVSGVKQLEIVKNSDYCVYIRPPIDCYKTLQFKSFTEIMNVGYSHGKIVFSTMQQFGGNESLLSFIQKEKHKKHSIGADTFLDSFLTSKPTTNPPTFTDLAERVCKIKKPIYSKEFNDISEDDEELELASEPEMRDINTDTDNEMGSYVKSRKTSFS